MLVKCTMSLLLPPSCYVFTLAHSEGLRSCSLFNCWGVCCWMCIIILLLAVHMKTCLESCFWVCATALNVLDSKLCCVLNVVFFLLGDFVVSEFKSLRIRTHCLFHLYRRLWRWNSVLKRQNIKFRCRGITQKKEYYIKYFK